VSWQRIDLSADEYAQPTEPPVTLGLFYRGKRHALSGPPEAAKTLVALVAGLEHKRAGHGEFGIVDFEMGEHATRLLLSELGATDEEIAAVYYAVADGPPGADDVAALVAAGVTFMVIDSAAGAYDASALDDNKRQDAERFARTWIEPLWKNGIATVLIDHVVKDTESRGKFAIGSERKLGTVDVHLGLEAITPLSRGTTGLFRITTHKDRPGHLPRPRAADLELASDPETHAISWTFRPAAEQAAESGDAWRPTVLMDRVLEYVDRHDYEPTSRTALTGAIKGNKQYLFQAIDFLILDGRLAMNGKKVVRSSGTIPEPFLADENGNVVPSSHSLQGGTVLGTVFEPEQTELQP
jgi:hypothetical protein